MSYDFLIDFTNYIIIYPIKWYNFLKRIINKVTFYYNIMIIPKNILEKSHHIYKEIISILEKHEIITNIIENGDIIILYLKSKKYNQLFTCWLKFIVLRACIDLFEEVKCKEIFSEDFYIVIGNYKIGFDNNRDYDLIITLNTKTSERFLTYSYNYYNFCEEIKNSQYLQKYLKQV
ncbi:MAG TPA: hypothetical protein GXZ48_02135 [Acholeplasmataceae bacterium]|nr:hypothetical protein [Acholeplasmataceae bacterium]